MLRNAWLLLGVLGATAVHVSADDQRLAVVVPAHRGDLDLAVASITRWPQPTICSPLTEHNVDLVLYYAGGAENDAAVRAAADTIAKSAGRCFSKMRTVFAELEQQDDVYPKAPSVMFYKMFLDDDVRSHLSEYDALAIIEWDVLVASDHSFEELHHAAFRVNEEFWVKGSNLGGTSFHSAAVSGMWQVLGHINGNAIYNNNDPAFVEYVDYTRARWEYEYPYDVALWLTISDFPHSWPLYQRYSSKFVTTNLIAYVGQEIVDNSSVSDAIAGQTLFIHGSGVESGSRASVKAVEAEKRERSGAPKSSLAARRDQRRLRAGSDIVARRLQDTCSDACAYTPFGATFGRVCDETCTAAEPTYGTLGCPTASSYATIGYNAAAYGENCRACFIDSNAALAADTANDRAIMCDTLKPVTVYFLGSADRRLQEAKRPFTDDVARGNLCTFIAGRADEADLCEVTVKSILHFNPGVRVAVAAEDAGLSAYASAVGDLPGVTVSATSDVTAASLYADEYCGADTSLILYLRAGSVVTRTFTAKDTHSPKGDVLVVYSGARNGFQNDALARKTELVLGSVAPSFTQGTDLLLPVGANQDLRDLVLRPEGEAGVDPELTMQMLTEMDDVFAVPQVMAALAYSKNTPGIWFINPQEWVAQNLFKATSIWDIPLLKPRYTCMIDPAQRKKSNIPNAVLADVLKSNLDFFSKGGTCESGLIDIDQQI